MMEEEDLFKTLHWTQVMVLQSGPEDRERIALAYKQAQELVAAIPRDNGDARPRIVACFERADTYRAADDIACVGWTLTAMQERVNERNLLNWRRFRKIIKTAIDLLPLPTPTVH